MKKVLKIGLGSKKPGPQKLGSPGGKTTWLNLFFYLCFFSFIFHPSVLAKRFKQNLILKPIRVTNPFSDLPLIHNYWVEQWIHLFQNSYSDRFRIWLERSYRYAPLMKEIFKQQNLPEDLIYLSMIESGFSPHAVSSAQAVGYWQFIQPTAQRFGLKKNLWLDERRDFEKSTLAACQYLRSLYKQFGDWWLAISAYNMGEQRLTHLVQKHKTKNFWDLAQKYDFPYETSQYVPQLIAAITIAKAPSLYGFNYLKIKVPYQYEVFYLPGGVNLRALAHYIHEPYAKIKQLNPELLRDRIPHYMENWRARLPKGSSQKVSLYITHFSPSQSQ